MIAFERSVFIRRPKQEIFDFVTDPANAPKWRSTIESAEWASEGAVGVGSRTRQTTRFMGRKQENMTEVTNWEPPDFMTQETVNGPSFEHSFRLQSKEDGTDFTVTGKMEAKGLLKIMAGMIIRQSEKMLEEELHSLKLLLEVNQD